MVPARWMVKLLRARVARLRNAHLEPFQGPIQTADAETRSPPALFPTQNHYVLLVRLASNS